MISPESSAPPQPKYELDALLVLGRGIDEDGRLSNTSEARACMAVDLAAAGRIGRIVFSGGRSWVQRDSGLETPSEGGAMRAVARRHMATHYPDVPRSTTYYAEETSTSTLENMVNSRPLLGYPDRTTRLGILSDALHFSEGRPQFYAGLVFPDTPVTIIDSVPNEAKEGAVSEEKLAMLMSRIFFARVFGALKGNDDLLMKRQRALEAANRAYRNLRGNS